MENSRDSMKVLHVDECVAPHAAHVPSAFVFIKQCDIVDSREDSERCGYKRLRVHILDHESAENVNELTQTKLKKWFDICGNPSSVITVRVSHDVLTCRGSTRSGSVMINVPADTEIRSMWVSLQKGNDHSIGDDYQSLIWNCVSILTYF